MPGADQSADDGGDQHRAGIARAEHRAGGQRAKDEAEDREHETEQTIAEEAGDDSAEEQHDRCRQLIGGWKHWGLVIIDL